VAGCGRPDCRQRRPEPDGLPIREISLITLAVARPDPDDEIIANSSDFGAKGYGNLVELASSFRVSGAASAPTSR
jgi:hypothetical protein